MRGPSQMESCFLFFFLFTEYHDLISRSCGSQLRQHTRVDLRRRGHFKRDALEVRNSAFLSHIQSNLLTVQHTQNSNIDRIPIFPAHLVKLRNPLPPCPRLEDSDHREREQNDYRRES